jgi:hypothetical protein
MSSRNPRRERTQAEVDDQNDDRRAEEARRTAQPSAGPSNRAERDSYDRDPGRGPARGRDERSKAPSHATGPSWTAYDQQLADNHLQTCYNTRSNSRPQERRYTTFADEDRDRDDGSSNDSHHHSRQSIDDEQLPNPRSRRSTSQEDPKARVSFSEQHGAISLTTRSPDQKRVKRREREGTRVRTKRKDPEDTPRDAVTGLVNGTIPDREVDLSRLALVKSSGSSGKTSLAVDYRFGAR